MICIFLLTMVVSSLLSIFRLAMQKTSDKERECTIIAQNVYEAVLNELSLPIYTSQTIANDVFLKELLENEDAFPQDEVEAKLTRYLSAQKEALDAQTTFVVSERSKRYYSYEGFNKVIDPDSDEHDVWYPIFVNKRKPYDLDVDIDQLNSNSWTVFCNARIEGEDGFLLGVCGIGLTMNNLQEVLKKVEDTYGVTVNLVNSNGDIQLDTDNILIESSHLFNPQYGSEKDGYSYRTSDGEFVVMRYVESLNWYLAIHKNTNGITPQDVLPVWLSSAGVVLVNLVSPAVIARKKEK